MLNRTLYWLTFLVLLYSVYRHAAGTLYTLGYRFNQLSQDTLPDHLQGVLPTAPIWADFIYGAGFLFSAAAVVLMLLRRKLAFWAFLVGGACARVDWIFFPFHSGPEPDYLSPLGFIRYFLVLALMYVLTSRRELR